MKWLHQLKADGLEIIFDPQNFPMVGIRNYHRVVERIKKHKIVTKRQLMEKELGRIFLSLVSINSKNR